MLADNAILLFFGLYKDDPNVPSGIFVNEHTYIKRKFQKEGSCTRSPIARGVWCRTDPFPAVVPLVISLSCPHGPYYFRAVSLFGTLPGPFVSQIRQIYLFNSAQFLLVRFEYIYIYIYTLFQLLQIYIYLMSRQFVKSDIKIFTPFAFEN